MEHHATIAWRRSSSTFTYDSYNRAHEWLIRGHTIAASAAPDFRGDPDRINPEDAFVAALSSCHMLTFLALAAKRKFIPDLYTDDAIGYLEKSSQGRMAITRVVLRPRIVWATGTSVSEGELTTLHNKAHDGCFIANSVTTDVRVEPIP